MKLKLFFLVVILSSLVSARIFSSRQTYPRPGYKVFPGEINRWWKEGGTIKSFGCEC